MTLRAMARTCLVVMSTALLSADVSAQQHSYVLIDGDGVTRSMPELSFGLACAECKHENRGNPMGVHWFVEPEEQEAFFRVDAAQPPRGELAHYRRDAPQPFHYDDESPETGWCTATALHHICSGSSAPLPVVAAAARGAVPEAALRELQITDGRWVVNWEREALQQLDCGSTAVIAHVPLSAAQLARVATVLGLPVLRTIRTENE